MMYNKIYIDFQTKTIYPVRNSLYLSKKIVFVYNDKSLALDKTFVYICHIIYLYPPIIPQCSLSNLTLHFI